MKPTDGNICTFSMFSNQLAPLVRFPLNAWTNMSITKQRSLGSVSQHQLRQYELKCLQGNMKTAAGPERPKAKKHDQQSGIHTRKKREGNSENMKQESRYNDFFFFFFFFLQCIENHLRERKKWIHKSLIVAVLTCYHNTSVSSRQLHKPHFCSHVILMHISIKVRDYIAHMTHLHPIPEEYHQGWGRLFIVHTIVLSVTPRA